MLFPRDGVDVAEALRSHGAVPALDEAKQASLRANGLVMVKLPADAVDSVLTALGGPTLDVREWHGQALDWRAIADAPFGRDGQAVAVDGRVRLYRQGQMELRLRGWTVQMETGPLVYVDLQSVYAPPPPRDLEVFMPSQRREPERFNSLSFDVALDAHSVYVISGRGPRETWWFDVGGATPAIPAASNRGPSDGAGPEAATPRTIGDLLFVGGGIPPTRGVIVISGRIPAELFPPGGDWRKDEAANPSASVQ